jgi:hypothetical protein
MQQNAMQCVRSVDPLDEEFEQVDHYQIPSEKKGR